ncbi:hypothetical protein A4A49_22042 [Nicotiana attenuata]|uniref:Uncharacterized protein n=1 Tax=Nicotiana attenuata TaxID=49451 RepID=A0A1J6KEA3_NICAT|nr:hypothetical protein A4A49_22042 [Nicotiana attenuata]
MPDEKKCNEQRKVKNGPQLILLTTKPSEMDELRPDPRTISPTDLDSSTMTEADDCFHRNFHRENWVHRQRRS